jgi:hypothetical protein
MWSITGWIHNKYRNRLTQPTVEKAVRAHGNLVLRKTMMERNKDVVVWDSQTVITEPDEQGVDDVDEEDSEVETVFVSDVGRLTEVVSCQFYLS